MDQATAHRRGERAAPLRAVVVGLGKTARLLRAGAALRDDVEIVGGVDVDPAKAGADLGEALGGEPLGRPVSAALADELARDDVDVVLHTATGDADEVADALGACLDAGKDALTVNWFVHAPAAYGARRAAELAERARRGGARAAGTGVNPGLLLDVLPVLWGTTFARVERVALRRVSEISTWGRGVLEQEVGLGRPLDSVAVPTGQLAQSCGILADGLHLDLDRWEETAEPIAVATDRRRGDLAVPAGRTAGFRRLARGLRGGTVVAEVEWLAIWAIDPDADGVENSSTLRIEGGGETVETTVAGGLLTDPYPATAARMLNAIAVLRALPPGIYRPDQLPLAVTP
ncbi:MAG: hypothetical protein GXY03_09275 [Solirubrobacterales bacterium]|nr:hypothetical protein [Solirubrobacterales bacterium]